VVSMEFPKLEEFLARLQKSWEQATKSMEEAVQQEKTKSSRIKSWRQYVVGKQEYLIYLIEPTLKEAGLKEIQTF